MSKNISLQCADNIRTLSVAMVEKAASGHPGGPMGGADFTHILYSEYLTFDPDDMSWPFRDRFFLDPGHMSAMLYAQLHLIGMFSNEDLQQFRQWKSPTPGHPELDIKRGIENTSGPLGLGHAFGAGAAIAEEFLRARFGEWMSHYTYLYISDGGIQEEISQGVGRIAGHLGLSKIIMFYDANDIQLSTKVDEVTIEDTAKKYDAWGWHVVSIDGNNHDQIRQAIEAGQQESQKPTLIIGKTIMGKGAVTEEGKAYEGEVETHGKPLGSSKASYSKTLANLGISEDSPFTVHSEVKAYYADVLNHKRQIVKHRKETYEKWKLNNPMLSNRLDQYLNGEASDIDWDSIPMKENDATRNASSAILNEFAKNIGNMIVASADLSNSDKTDGFLKGTSAFERGKFSGAFLHAGVSELTMAALCTGMTLHGGVIAVCGTFFAFSDYMKPVLRVAALMECPVKFLWTHDAFRVGEDGPTHQPVEQEAQLRLLEKVHNHHGKSSFVALRPADGPETIACWKLALSINDRPVGLIFSRQNIKQLPAKSSDRREESRAANKGGYVVYNEASTPDIILVANGSEVATCFEAVPYLEEHDIKVRIVSIPSEGLFKSQDVEYQEEVLPLSIKKYGVTAGLSTNLLELVGDPKAIHGLNHFGYSAPYQVLDEKFGFTGKNIAQKVMNYLEAK